MRDRGKVGGSEGTREGREGGRHNAQCQAWLST